MSRKKGAAAGAPSYLDTNDITRAGRDRCAPGEAARIEAVGAETKAYRLAKAERHRERAREKVQEAREQGMPTELAKGEGKWDRDRARGHEEAPERAILCGADEVVVTCSCCGKECAMRSGCRKGLLCRPCRDSIARRKRAAFRPSRGAAVANAGAKGLLMKNRRKGAWSEKFMTLTAPHVRTDTIGERIERVFAAWENFLRRMNRHWREIAAAESSHYFRSFEWTPGDDEKGHPHIHLWMLCPWIDKDEFTIWWRMSLMEAGLTAEQAAPVEIHVERVRSADVERELVKYITKDYMPDGSRIDVKTQARVYEALDGKRLTQCSSGFAALAEGKSFCECGEELYIKFRQKPEEE